VRRANGDELRVRLLQAKVVLCDTGNGFAVELFDVLVVFGTAPLAMDSFRDSKNREERAGKAQAARRGDGFREEIRDRRDKDGEEYEAKADREVNVADADVEGDHKFSLPTLFKA